MRTIKVDFGGQMRPPRVNPSVVGLVVLALFAVLLITQSVVIVEPEEVALILRFGEYQRTLKSGLHFKLPLLESKIRVPVERQLK